MDWSTVRREELLAALVAADWGHPRPIPELFGRLNVPKKKNLESRLKSNVYYYRVWVAQASFLSTAIPPHRCALNLSARRPRPCSNYAALLVLTVLAALVRQPLSILYLGLVALGALCTNDAFAAALNDRALRLLRRLSPSLALRVRAAAGPAHARCAGRERAAGSEE